MVANGQEWSIVWHNLLLVTQPFLSTLMLYNKDFLYTLENTHQRSWVPLSLHIQSFSRTIGSAILIFISHFSFRQTDLPRLTQVFIFQALRLHLKQKQNYGSGLARGEHVDPGMWFPSGRLQRGEVGRRICANLTVYLKKTLTTANLNVSWSWGGMGGVLTWADHW